METSNPLTAEERVREEEKMDHSMKSLIALWVMWAVALLAAKFLTPEIWRWYKWYALVVGVICTLILAPAAFLR